MATEPENLVLELLRDIRRDMSDLRNIGQQHSVELEKLRKEMHEWQETIATGVGLAVHANVRHQDVKAELEDIRRRLARLEQAGV